MPREGSGRPGSGTLRYEGPLAPVRGIFPLSVLILLPYLLFLVVGSEIARLTW